MVAVSGVLFGSNLSGVNTPVPKLMSDGMI